MATVKKVKKYQNSGPAVKASSDKTRVTSRNYVAEDRIKAKKAKDAKDAADLEKRSVSRQSYYSNGEPAYRLSADTTGYSKGKQSFPGIIRTGKSSYYDKKTTFSREKVDNIIKNPIGSKEIFKKGGNMTKAKSGKQMIKRADGTYSQRGLWDNLRSKAAKNKASGAKPKAPTKAMLTQEKKIKAKGK